MSSPDGALEAIDWSRPWLRQFPRPTTSGSISDVLDGCGQAPIRFVGQSMLPPGTAYEQFIFDTGTVPTRDNLHDFFNGLCWITFPQTKKKLNELQAAEIAEAGVQNVRGPVRDALTLFDENAAFLVAPQAIWDALEARDWKCLFVELRPLWQESQLVLFGHALLEKLVNPRKPITAHVYQMPVAESSIHQLDTDIAASLSAERLALKPFLPLPVLGVPGWWAENENFSFYDDSHVFRPRTQNNP
ncbi:MAG: DUF3025 domain-containing protein [Pseudomonadota bacterium]